MNNFRDKLKNSGYDSEEAYFYARDKELIAKSRAEKKSHLRLLPGGKKDQVAEKPLPRGQISKKAA